MSQWYAIFIKNYANICELLYNLKRKLKRFIWSIEAQKAFDVVKAAITKAPVIKFPDFKISFELFTDASSIGVGAVLNQEQRPVVFASRTLSAAERNYTVTERECLAVVWALNKFRTYLGSLPIKVITDHTALTHLTNGKNLSNRMIRWALKLAEFNIEWKHRPGTQNTVADVLSGNPNESIIREKANCAIIRNLVLSSRDQLIKEQRTDPELGHIYRYLENPEDNSVNAAILAISPGSSISSLSQARKPRQYLYSVAALTWGPKNLGLVPRAGLPRRAIKDVKTGETTIVGCKTSRDEMR
ncbi:retrovirus-related Pol polyprotein from transposon 17.6 [Trichonephila clavipes]|nr:retrovirus-related Pol polyprotein from transposon 17.6 [Trichonephila clavipes]